MYTTLKVEMKNSFFSKVQYLSEAFVCLIQAFVDRSDPFLQAGCPDDHVGTTSVIVRPAITHPCYRGSRFFTLPAFQ